MTTNEYNADRQPDRQTNRQTNIHAYIHTSMLYTYKHACIHAGVRTQALCKLQEHMMFWKNPWDLYGQLDMKDLVPHPALKIQR